MKESGKRQKVSKRKIIMTLITILLVFMLLPYLIPVSKATENLPETPYGDSQFTEIESIMLHYRRQFPEGQQIKGRILLVHGLGGSTYSFNGNVPALTAAGYEVLSVDLPGFGYSSRSTDFDHSQLSRAALLWKLIAQIEGEDAAAPENTASTANADKPATAAAPADTSWFLAGHSMGGGTVTAMAYLNPAKTKGVVLFDGALLETNQGSAEILQIPPLSRYVQVILERFVVTEKNIVNFLTSAYGTPPTSEQVQGYIAPLSLPGTARSAMGILKTSGSLPISSLKEIDVPFLGIWGQQDTWVPVTQAEELKMYLKNFKYVTIPGAYHCPMETHIEEFNKILIESLW